MAGQMLQRHGSGPVSQVSGYVDASFALDVHAIAEEYHHRVRSALTRSSSYIVDHDSTRGSAMSNRGEELLAHHIYQAGASRSFAGIPSRVAPGLRAMSPFRRPRIPRSRPTSGQRAPMIATRIELRLEFWRSYKRLHGLPPREYVHTRRAGATQLPGRRDGPPIDRPSE